MPTRTRNGYFFAVHLGTGNVHFEDEVYEARDGVIECPLEVAEGAHWARATAAQIEAYVAAPKTPVKAAPTTNPMDESIGKALAQKAEDVIRQVDAAPIADAADGRVDQSAYIARALELETAGKNRTTVLAAFEAKLAAIAAAQ